MGAWLAVGLRVGLEVGLRVGLEVEPEVVLEVELQAEQGESLAGNKDQVWRRLPQGATFL